ncbi:MAG: site-specific integrase, partial [Bryobacteraceae bacterium]
GSIYRLADGRWAASVSMGWKQNKSGKVVWRRKVFAGKTRYAVARRLKAALTDQEHGINIDPERQTVAQFLTGWLESVKADVSPATYVSYEGTVRLHLIPALGKILLAKLGAQHIQQLKQEKLDAVVSKGPGVKKLAEGAPPPEPRHLSAATVRYCLLVLRMALDRACKLDLVPRNVALLVDFPKVEHGEIRPYNPEEAQQFVEGAKGHRLGALFTVALSLGLRKGEALALQWPAIDLERGTLAVRLALQRIKMPGEKKGRLILKEPKRSSRRTINLPQVCLSALLEHRARQEQERILAGTRWKEGGFVFTTGIGTPLEPRNLERAFSEILAIAKLRHVRIHDLRHTAATLLLVQGVHPRVVMELLGHSQIAVTMNIYSHVVPALRKEAADQMDAALKPVANRVANISSVVKPN